MSETTNVDEFLPRSSERAEILSPVVQEIQRAVSQPEGRGVRLPARTPKFSSSGGNCAGRGLAPTSSLPALPTSYITNLEPMG